MVDFCQIDIGQNYGRNELKLKCVTYEKWPHHAILMYDKEKQGGEIIVCLSSTFCIQQQAVFDGMSCFWLFSFYYSTDLQKLWNRGKVIVIKTKNLPRRSWLEPTNQRTHRTLWTSNWSCPIWMAPCGRRSWSSETFSTVASISDGHGARTARCSSSNDTLLSR